MFVNTVVYETMNSVINLVTSIMIKFNNVCSIVLLHVKIEVNFVIYHYIFCHIFKNSCPSQNATIINVTILHKL